MTVEVEIDWENDLPLDFDLGLKVEKVPEFDLEGDMDLEPSLRLDNVVGESDLVLEVERDLEDARSLLRAGGLVLVAGGGVDSSRWRCIRS